MRVLHAIALVCLTGGGVRPQAQNQSDIESLIASVFSEPSSSTQAQGQGGQVRPSTVFPESTTQAQNQSDIESFIASVFPEPSSSTQRQEQGGQVKPSTVFPESTTQAQNQSDIESLIASVFSEPSSSTQAQEQGGQVKPSTVFPESTTQAQNQSDIKSLIASVFSEPSSSTQAQEQGVQVKPSTVFPESTTQAPPEQGGEVRPSNVSSDSGTCKTSKNQEGKCVPYYLCKPDDASQIDGEGIIDINGNTEDGSCESYLDVCCTLANLAPSATPAPPADVKQGCGWRNPDGVGFRITGDVNNEAKFGEFPWMAAVLELHPSIEGDPNSAKLKVYRCGGSLINLSAVLTAAHCVHRRRQDLLVRAGEWDTQTTKEIYPHQDRNVHETIVHKEFLRASLVYDIALLILEKPMELAPNVGPACLPAAATGGLDPARAAGGVRCLASGWGKDSIGKKGRYQVILKRVELPVIPRLQCLDMLRARSRRRITELHRSFMCAGGERGHGICKGDGGAPLVCPIENERNRYQQYGIAAWGLGCGEEAPSVYADVGQLRAWVDYHILAHGLDPATYTY